MARNPEPSRRLVARRSRVRYGVFAAIAMMAAAAVAAAVLSSGGGEPKLLRLTAQQLGHVHGIAVAPETDALYIATHLGLYRVDVDGAPTLVGEKRDYMGFTVASPGRFLASGHPAKGSDGPANLGLIESIDEGRSWKTLSLGGRADFHALAAGAGRIYGYSGGALMASRDGNVWETVGATEVGELAVNPDNGDMVAATTNSGVALSLDGGRTFKALSAAPSLTFLSWPVGNLLIGATNDGAIYVSSDAGASWERRGQVQQPEALTATANAVYLATGDAIVESHDGGRTFTTRIEIAAG